MLYHIQNLEKSDFGFFFFWNYLEKVSGDFVGVSDVDPPVAQVCWAQVHVHTGPWSRWWRYWQSDLRQY